MVKDIHVVKGRFQCSQGVKHENMMGIRLDRSLRVVVHYVRAYTDTLDVCTCTYQWSTGYVRNMKSIRCDLPILKCILPISLSPKTRVQHTTDYRDKHSVL